MGQEIRQSKEGAEGIKDNTETGKLQVIMAAFPFFFLHLFLKWLKWDGTV